MLLLLCVSQFRTESASVTTTKGATQHHYFLPVVYNARSLIKGVAVATVPYDRGVCAEVAYAGSEWWYNWGFRQFPCDNGIEQVLMIPTCQDAERILNGTWIVPDEPEYSEWIAYLNEPDLVPPTCSPQNAAALYYQLGSYLENYKVISPAPSRSGVTWLWTFANVYRNHYGNWPRFDALAVHCYANSYQRCRSHTERVIEWAKAWDVGEIWITEFSFIGDAQEEARQYIQWMRRESMVTRSAWFTNRHQDQWDVGPLFDYDTGVLTEWGELYSTE